jgi:hypothetical protein
VSIEAAVADHRGQTLKGQFRGQSGTVSGVFLRLPASSCVFPRLSGEVESSPG